MSTGGGMSMIALIFASSALCPAGVIMCPIYFTVSTLCCIFSLLNFTFAAFCPLHHFMKDFVMFLFRGSSYDHIVCNNVHTQDVAKVSQFFCWNTSMADLIPNRSLRTRYWPHSVLKVHSFEDGSSNFICQCPSFSSKDREDGLSCKFAAHIFRCWDGKVLPLDSFIQVTRVQTHPW